MPNSSAVENGTNVAETDGIAAAILADRKLAQYEDGAKVPATSYAIADAIKWAEEIMKRMDEKWPRAGNES